MPALILDEKEKNFTRFISTNGLVEDPSALEKERSMINPWTAEEKEIFMDKLAIYGKDFRKIASFLVHKTTADCIEFYYKNHKSDCFRHTKKHSGSAKQGKPRSTNNYLVASGKRWNRESNAASLDILGAASAIAANAEVEMENQQKCISKYLLAIPASSRKSRADTGVLERSSSLDADNIDRETVAADVLAGICGSLSSEAMGSCITSAVDPGEGYHEWKGQRVGCSSRWPLTPEVTQNIDDETCSDDSCGEMDPTDWTDEEKSIFVQAVSSHGKDFAVISQYVRSKSRDQCMVFYSKARKCLGLDMICPGSGNIVRTDANAAGSDTDDACVVETVSALCVEKSQVRMEDLPSSDEKLTVEPDGAGTVSVEAVMDILKLTHQVGDVEGIDTEQQGRKITNDSPVEDKKVENLDGDVDMHTKPVQVEGTIIAPSGLGGEDNHGEASEDPDRADNSGDGRVVDEVGEQHISESDGLVQMLPETAMVVDKYDDNPCEASGPGEVMKSKPDTHGNGSHRNAAAHMGSSSGSDGVPEYQQHAELESDTAQKISAVPLSQNNCLVPMNLAPHAAVAGVSTSPAPGTENTGKEDHEASRQAEQHFSTCSLLGSAESPHILEGYLMPVLATKEVNCDGSYKRSDAVQSIPKLDANFHIDQRSTRDAYLQKCNGLKPSNSGGELLFQSREQAPENNRSSSSSDVEKPRRNGDVKLFGQILTNSSSQQKASSNIQQNGNNENHRFKSFNVNLAGDQAAEGNSAQAKLDHNNFLGSENTPARSYGFWDGSRIQTGFPSLPDSAMLLAKYPAAFGNYAVPSSRVEQRPLQGVTGGERSTTFPARDIGSSNGAEFQGYRNREVQPFTLDLKQRQDMLLSEMQRRNGFDVVSGMQQSRGMVGMNVVGRGGILVGGQCTGVSDPVAAIKMHYAQAEQFSGQAGSIIREDDSWRGKGNLGR